MVADSDASLEGAWLPEPSIRRGGGKRQRTGKRITTYSRKTYNDGFPKGRIKASSSAHASETYQPKRNANNYQPTEHKNRVYCMVPFIWTPSALMQYTAIHATWGQRCDILRFFIDPVIGDQNIGFYNMSTGSGVIAAQKANMTLPDDVVILHNMRRPWHTCGSEENEEKNKPIGNCRNIFEKVWRMITYVGYGSGGFRVGDSWAGHHFDSDGKIVKEDEHDADAYRAEWFVKVDSDTYLFPDNVGRYVEARKWSYNDNHYFGHVLNHRRDDRGVSIVAGGAVFYSRAALLAAGDAFRNMPMDKGDKEEDGTCRDSYTGTEEVVTAVCLKKHSNIVAEPAIDTEGREQVSLYEVDDMLGYNRTEQGEWWYWEAKTKFPCHDDGDCLASLPLAFHHYKDPQFFLDFEKEFYGSVMKGEADETLIKKNDGRVASRHWPRFDRTYRYFERIRSALRGAGIGGDSQPLVVSNAQHAQQSSQLNNRLYCLVPFIWSAKFVPSYHAIHKTWGKRCDILRFFIDPIIGDNETGYLDLRTNGTDYKLPDDVIVISEMQRRWNACADDPEQFPDGNCRNIWEKIWRSWVWVDDYGDSNLAEWFVKIDADSFLFPENLKRYIKEIGWKPDDHHYFGHILMHRVNDGGEPMIAGAAVFFSRATVKSAANIFRKFEDDAKTYEHGMSSALRCKDSYTDQEELVTSVCLKEHLGVDAFPVLDEEGRELVTIGEIEDVLLWDRKEQGEWWYWQNKRRKHPQTGKDMHQCCGDLPIAFHGYKDPQWFFQLEHEFYQESGVEDLLKKDGYEWRNPRETKTYFDRVRKAMKEASITRS